MAKVYIDAVTFHCHASQNDDGTLIPYESEFFDGKCTEFIEGYRLIPFDESWTRSDGEVFRGEMITPWKDYRILDGVQRAYELGMLADYKAACERMGIVV